jgi:hypothetical protein
MPAFRFLLLLTMAAAAEEDGYSIAKVFRKSIDAVH